MSWYTRPSTVWIEVGLWFAALIAGIVTEVSRLRMVATFGLVLRIFTALVVRKVIRRNGQE